MDRVLRVAVHRPLPADGAALVGAEALLAALLTAAADFFREVVAQLPSCPDAQLPAAAAEQVVHCLHNSLKTLGSQTVARLRYRTTPAAE